MKAVNASGDKVENACCHISRIGLSSVGFSRGVVCDEEGAMFSCVEV